MDSYKIHIYIVINYSSYKIYNPLNQWKSFYDLSGFEIKSDCSVFYFLFFFLSCVFFFFFFGAEIRHLEPHLLFLG